MAANDVLNYLKLLCKQQMQQAETDLAKVSIALGAVEIPLTSKDRTQQQWPEALEAETNACLAVFEQFVAGLDQQIAKQQLTETRAKAKLVADTVWSKLTGVFVNDVLHVQHVYSFTQHIKPGKKQGKRQLDCGGVVTTVLAACHSLAQKFGHADLAKCCFQVSEDHCWLNIDAEGRREGTIEVTTSNAAKRVPVEATAWQGWLYSGGHAPLCSPQMTITALVASMNPCITPKRTGQDSTEVQHIQHMLLRMIQDNHPDLMYPAAVGCLADLEEIQIQESLEQAVEAQDAQQLQQHLQLDKAQKLFELAIQKSMQSDCGASHLWYPYSYLFGYLMRRAQFLIEETQALLGSDALASANALMTAAMQTIGAQHGSRVLQHYRFGTTDEQLYKDLEGVLEQACDALHTNSLADADHMAALLEYWDGICHLFAGKTKPAHWIARLLKALQRVPIDTRTQAVAQASVSSQMMLKAKPMWAELKGPKIKALFEVADIADSHAKRQRRDTTRRLDSDGVT